MRDTRTDRCGGQLVNAQTAVNRAVFELNIRECSKPPGRGRAPNDEYTLHCVLDALAELSAAAKFLVGQKGSRR